MSKSNKFEPVVVKRYSPENDGFFIVLAIFGTSLLSVLGGVGFAYLTAAYL